MDFLPRAMDQIVNHLDKIETMSHGEFSPKVIIRTSVGSTNPLDVGLQHSQDLTEIFKVAVNFPVYKPMTADEIDEVYDKAINLDGPCMIVEMQDLYKE